MADSELLAALSDPEALRRHIDVRLTLGMEAELRRMHAEEDDILINGDPNAAQLHWGKMDG